MKRSMLYRLTIFALSLSLCLISLSTKAQFSLSVNSSNSCYSAAGNNTAIVYVVNAPTSAAVFTWTITGSSCTPSYTFSAPSGSILQVTYPCCDTYTFICNAYNSSSNLVAITGSSITVACPPFINITGPTSVCPGSTVALSASGAQTYTWNSILTSPTFSILPTTNTTIVRVVGTNSAGCSDSSQVQINLIPQVNAAFTYTIGTNGLVYFTNTSTNTISSSSYIWNFGNGSGSNVASPTVTYTNNGVYTVTLSTNASCGWSTSIQSLTITNVGSSCQASIGFTQNPVVAGTFTFASLSTGVSSSTTYYWDFGNGITYSATGLSGVSPPVQSYSLNGTYIVTLSISNPSCISHVTASINLSSACLLLANYYVIQTGTTTIDLINTSSGTLAGTTYSWSYGDGTGGSGFNSSHTYSTPGTYSIMLYATTLPNCSSVKMVVFTVNACSLTADFTHTINPNGIVSFKDISQSVTTSKGYYWNFGDGVYSLQRDPSHSYYNSGVYNVTFKVSDSTRNYCIDSLIQTINVTGIPCEANSGFSLTQTDTTQWTLTPSYPWNIATANWSWGDGTSSNSIYAAHTYSASGTYLICLSVTVSCGTSATYCNSLSIQKASSINVKAPETTTGFNKLQPTDLSVMIYPNPNPGVFSVKLNAPAFITVYDLVGKEVFRSDPASNLSPTIWLNEVPDGIYVMRATSGKASVVQKIIVQH